MSRRLKQATAVLLVLLAAAQLVRPERANPPTDAARTIEAHVGTTSGLPSVLNRACGDCHSNTTAWPWYTHIAPLSWAMAYAVREGRTSVNFSEWSAYSPEQRRTLLVASCHDAAEGKMPGGAWTLLHSEAQLSAQDVDTICAASRQPVTHAAAEREPAR